MTTASKITLIRVLFIPLYMVMMYLSGGQPGLWMWLSLALFIIASLTDYVDGYTKVAGKITYNYPDASKILYKGGKLNDQLTKIITQKYIANVPYGVVEMWNDRRRLGLPFFEIAANEGTLTGSDMESFYTTEDWKSGQKWSHYIQRMRYTTALENSDKEQYQNALNLLGGDNTMMSPLWWAIK